MHPVIEELVRKGAVRAAKSAWGKVLKYIRDDQLRSYALKSDVAFRIDGTKDKIRVGVHPPFRTADGLLEYDPVSEFVCTVTVHAFPASAKAWNGPDVIPDYCLGAMAASLLHDLWWGRAAEISKLWGMRIDDVYLLGNDFLHAVWRAYDPDGAMPRLAYAVCNVAVPWYHRLKKAIGLACVACLAVSLAGCAAFRAPPGLEVEVIGVEAVEDAMETGAVIP